MQLAKTSGCQGMITDSHERGHSHEVHLNLPHTRAHGMDPSGAISYRRICPALILYGATLQPRKEPRLMLPMCPHVWAWVPVSQGICVFKTRGIGFFCVLCTSEFSNVNERFEHEALDHTKLQGIPERFQTTWVKAVIECGKTFDLVIRSNLG